MFSTDAKIRAGFTSSLASRAPRSKADFSTLKFQVLIVRLSQDLVSVDIFKNEDHLTRTYLQLPLRQWGAGNVYLLVLSSWKVNIAENPIAVMGL